MTDHRDREPGSTRAALFLDLAGRLTARHPRWVLLKGIDSALHGSGDLDSAAPGQDWPVIEETFRGWASDHGLSPVIVCRHGAIGRILIAFEPGAREMLELDLLRSRSWRGSRLFEATDLLAHATLRDPGYRVVRPGVEGVLKLLWHGVRRGGGGDPGRLAAKNVIPLLREDPDGVTAGVDLLPHGRREVQHLVDACLSGRWDRPAALRLEARYVAESLRRPLDLARGLRFRLVTTRRCPVFVTMMRGGRRVPGEFDDWLGLVARSHDVTGWPGFAAE
jgi:hypothetical protein